MIKKLLIACVFALCVSCEEENSGPDKFCWDCHTVMNDNGNINTYDARLCDMTEAEKKEHEAKNTASQTWPGFEGKTVCTKVP